MIDPVYRAQVDLILQVLPSVAKEECFALKGGTAINLFVNDLPRLSVDIDLTYMPFDSRDTALENIAAALNRIRRDIAGVLPQSSVTMARQTDGTEAKLTCQLSRAQIKIEVNTIMRGHIAPPRMMQVSEKVQDEFGKFAAINVISHGELFGGKICAALDRQHPRDLFDIHQLFQSEGFTDEVHKGFMSCLLSSPRPIHEMIAPNLIDQRGAFDTRFTGMTTIPFSYEDFETTRHELVRKIGAMLNDQDKEFLLSFMAGKPNWDLGFADALPQMPAIRWKLQNINKLLSQNPAKHSEQLKALSKVLESN